MIISVVVFGLNLLQAGTINQDTILNALMFAVALAVAAIPEALGSIVTIVQAMGTQKMAKENAVIKDLKAVESLGCVSVICSDKTGTLTQNKMTVQKIYINGESIIEEQLDLKYESHRHLLYDMVLNNDSSIVDGKGIGDPTEYALLETFRNIGFDENAVRDGLISIEEVPFDSDRKMMSTKYKMHGVSHILTKGALDVILERCIKIATKDGVRNITEDDKKAILEQNRKYSEDGLRVLTFAYKESEEELSTETEYDYIFLGLVAMIDPPREESKQAVADAIRAGIKPIMITGDHKKTAVAVAAKAGLLKGGMAITGAELDKLSDEELDRDIGKYTVFARVEPVHKLRIVKSFKRRGEIVTMTGDGVNDAPAVKEADVGVAMGVTGTDVTKQAADVILMDDNLATLVNAVEQGRCVYANIRKFVRYLLSCNIGEVLTMFLGIVMGMPIILLPVQILLVNLVTDGLPAIALGMEKPESDIMNRPPRRSDEGFFSGGLMWKIVLRGVLIGLSTLASFTTVMRLGGSVEVCRTCALITLVVSQLIHVFECRSERRSIFRMNPFGNMKLVGAAAVSFAVLAAAVMIPQLQVVFSTVAPDIIQLLAAIGFSIAVPLLAAFF